MDWWAPLLGRVGSPLRREDAVFRRRIVGLDCPNRRARLDNVLGEDRSIAAFVAPVQLSCWIGQPNSSGNPPEGAVTRTEFGRAQFGSPSSCSGRGGGSPCPERFVSEDAKRAAGGEMALDVECVVDGGVNGQETLG